MPYWYYRINTLLMCGVSGRGCIHQGLALSRRLQIVSSISTALNKLDRLSMSRLPRGRRVVPKLPNHYSVVSHAG